MSLCELFSSHTLSLTVLCLVSASAIVFFLAVNLETTTFMWLQRWIFSSNTVAGTQSLCYTKIHTLISLRACPDLWSLQTLALRALVSGI